MLEPFSLCLEALDAKTPEQRYLCCVALPGRQPGLAVDAAGSVLWMGSGEAAFELWVTADERLALWRLADAVPVIVSRAGRSLSVPCEKPVILIGGDEIEVAGRRFRLHLHGEASSIEPPHPLPEASLRRIAQAAAAAIALTAAVAVPIQVRAQAPAPPARPQPSVSASPASGESAGPTTGTTSAPGCPVTEPTTSPSSAVPPAEPGTNASPIEVRERPPDVSEPGERLARPAPGRRPAGPRSHQRQTPTTVPPIEVRETPPKPQPDRKPGDGTK